MCTFIDNAKQQLIFAKAAGDEGGIQLCYQFWIHMLVVMYKEPCQAEVYLNRASAVLKYIIECSHSSNVQGHS